MSSTDTPTDTPAGSPAGPPDAPDAPVRRRRGRPAIGRVEPLERDEILERAMAIVRSDGLEALSMRRLAADLGVTPMAIYRHIPDKPHLIDALVAQVWGDLTGNLAPGVTDLVEFIVAGAMNTRRVWLDNFELANLSMAVAVVDDDFIDSMTIAAGVFRAAGFPDVGLAFNAVQTFTMGAIAVNTNRAVASAYFGRDPDVSLDHARALLDARNASPHHRAVVEARYGPADDEHFEAGLRALVAGLLGQTG